MCQGMTAIDMEFDEMGVALERAVRMIRDELGGDTRRDVEGWVRCPRCGAVLKYATNSINGNIWGICETRGCLSFIH